MARSIQVMNGAGRVNSVVRRKEVEIYSGKNYHNNGKQLKFRSLNDLEEIYEMYSAWSAHAYFLF